MANFAYIEAAQMGFTGLLDLLESGLDVRVLTVMSNSTAGTQRDATTISGFTTLDEYDGTNYPPARLQCANQVVNKDVPNQRSEFSHDVLTYANLGAGSRQAIAHIYFQQITDDTDSKPLFHVDTGGYPYDGNGGNVTITPNAQGAAQLQAP